MARHNGGNFSIAWRLLTYLGNSKLIIKTCFFISLVWIFCTTLYLTNNIYPETTMVINSQCKRPLQGWDGKVFNIQLWWNSIKQRPSYFNLHNELDFFNYDSENILINQYNNISEEYSFTTHLRNNAKAMVATKPPHQPLIIWGSHHKTGTFLAKKMFSKICSIMKWCCLFHITRDSIHALQYSLQNEPVHILAHNQWIWHPEQDLNLTNYYFIHFYRHPYKKIISSYKYHLAGSEYWTTKKLQYAHLCNQTTALIRPTTAAITAVELIPRERVFDFCRHVHLCENCCRKEHEWSQLTSTELHRFIPIHEVKYGLRRPEEYQSLCQSLGQVSWNESLQSYLQQHSVLEGLVVEAGLNYYESLRMMRLVNWSSSSSSSSSAGGKMIHIDLDELSSNFSSQTWKLLEFLEEMIPSYKQRVTIHTALQFYDLQSSPVYRWSMTSHITSSTVRDPVSDNRNHSSQLMKINTVTGGQSSRPLR